MIAFLIPIVVTPWVLHSRSKNFFRRLFFRERWIL